MSKALLMLMRQPPYSSSLARTAIDATLAAAAFDQEVQVLFSGPGVLQLLTGQDGEAIATRTLSKIINSFELYDISTLHVDASSLTQYGVNADQLPENCKLLDEEQIKSLIASADHVLGF